MSLARENMSARLMRAFSAGGGSLVSVLNSLLIRPNRLMLYILTPNDIQCIREFAMHV